MSVVESVVPRALQRWWSVPLSIFMVTRIVDALMFVLASRSQMAFNSEGVHLETAMPADPGYWRMMTNWDGQWYWTIAEHGYQKSLATDNVDVLAQSELAFFPLFPMSVRAVMFITDLSFPVAASLLSTVAAGAAMLLLYRWIESVGGRLNAAVAVAALSSFPAAPVLQAAYTESLALLLIIISLYLLSLGRYRWMLLSATALALTRAVALPLAAVCLAVYWRRMRSDADNFGARDRVTLLGVGTTIAASSLLWPLLVGAATGDPSAYQSVQETWIVFDFDAIGPWPSWMAHALAAPTAPESLLTIVMLCLIVAIVVHPRAAVWPFELRVWAAFYSFYVACSTLIVGAVVRYAMLIVVGIFPWGFRSQWKPSTTRSVTMVGSVMVFGFLLQAIWIWWFFSPQEHHVGWP